MVCGHIREILNLFSSVGLSIGRSQIGQKGN